MWKFGSGFLVLEVLLCIESPIKSMRFNAQSLYTVCVRYQDQYHVPSAATGTGEISRRIRTFESTEWPVRPRRSMSIVGLEIGTCQVVSELLHRRWRTRWAIYAKSLILWCLEGDLNPTTLSGLRILRSIFPRTACLPEPARRNRLTWECLRPQRSAKHQERGNRAAAFPTWASGLVHHSSLDRKIHTQSS